MNSTTDHKMSADNPPQESQNLTGVKVADKLAPMTLPDDIELREKVNKLLDFFTEPGGGEVYLKDLENDLVELIATYRKKWEADARLGMIEYYDQIPDNKAMDWKGLLADNREAVEYELSQLKEKTND